MAPKHRNCQFGSLEHSWHKAFQPMHTQHQHPQTPLPKLPNRTLKPYTPDSTWKFPRIHRPHGYAMACLGHTSCCMLSHEDFELCLAENMAMWLTSKPAHSNRGDKHPPPSSYHLGRPHSKSAGVNKGVEPIIPSWVRLSTCESWQVEHFLQRISTGDGGNFLFVNLSLVECSHPRTIGPWKTGSSKWIVRNATMKN